MIAFNHLFESVSWEDEEPTLIEDLLDYKIEEFAKVLENYKEVKE